MGQTVRVGGGKNKGAEMKLVTFMKEGQKERRGMLGALLEGDDILQLQPAAALYHHEVGDEVFPVLAIPKDPLAFHASNHQIM